MDHMPLTVPGNVVIGSTLAYQVVGTLVYDRLGLVRDKHTLLEVSAAIGGFALGNILFDSLADHIL